MSRSSRRRNAVNKVAGVDFVTIPVIDIARAVGFYQDVIGLEITRDQRPEGMDRVGLSSETWSASLRPRCQCTGMRVRVKTGCG
jgi:hypothetical protein